MALIVDTTTNARAVYSIDPATGLPVAGGGDASAANQLTQITAEQAILAKLTADPATQTTLAAILAKIIAAPATEAKQDTGNTSLASILAKIIAAPATEAKQDTLAALFTRPFPAATTPWTYAAAASGIVNTNTAVTFKTSAGGSLKNYIVAMQIMWEALGTATELAIRDGAGGTVLWRMKIPASLAGCREVILPVPLSGTAATLLEVVTLTASTTGAVYFDAQGFAAL